MIVTTTATIDSRRAADDLGVMSDDPVIGDSTVMVGTAVHFRT